MPWLTGRMTIGRGDILLHFFNFTWFEGWSRNIVADNENRAMPLSDSITNDWVNNPSIVNDSAIDGPIIDGLFFLPEVEAVGGADFAGHGH